MDYVVLVIISKFHYFIVVLADRGRSHNPQQSISGSMMKVLTVNHLHPSFKSRFNCENMKEGINNEMCQPIFCTHFFNALIIFYFAIIVTLFKAKILL